MIRTCVVDKARDMRTVINDVKITPVLFIFSGKQFAVKITCYNLRGTHVCGGQNT